MTENWPSTHEQRGCHVKTIEQLKFFSPKDVSYNFTKSYQVSAASANYSRSSRWKTRGGLPRKIGLKNILFFYKMRNVPVISKRQLNRAIPKIIFLRNLDCSKTRSDLQCSEPVFNRHAFCKNAKGTKFG